MTARHQAKRQAQKAGVDTIVVDDTSVEDEGIDLCRRMRQIAPEAAIVLISDQDPAQPWLVDRHVPPTAPSAAMTRALITTRSQANTRLLEAGDFTLDRVTGELQGPSGTHQLSPKLGA